MLQVCRGLACSINGAEDMMAYFRERLGIGHLETTDDGVFSYEEVECLAACDKASCMQVNLDFVYSLTPHAIDEMLAAMRSGTYSTQPMAQIEVPGRTWAISQESDIARGKKSSGAIGVPLPNNAGGVGDRSGIIMLDHIIDHDVEFYQASLTETLGAKRGRGRSRAVVRRSRTKNAAMPVTKVLDGRYR